RFDGADTQALDRSFVEDAAKEIFELDAGRQVAAVHAEIDSAEDDFAVARISETPDFVDDLRRRKAAAFAPHEWNHAVGAAAVTAVLDFQDGAGVIVFAAEDGSGEKRGVLKDVAGEDFCAVRVKGVGVD